MLEPFGPNVVSTDGELWRSHIRITLPSFGEQVQNVVWEETMRQTDILCHSWSELGKTEIKKSIYQLTMNTMSLAGFGWRTDWASGRDVIPSGHRMSLVEAATKMISELPLILLLPRFLLRILPDKTVWVAFSEFEKYMDELLVRENLALTKGSSMEPRRENLLTALLRSRRESAGAEKSHTGPGVNLTDQEVKGNIFIFLLAGKKTLCLVSQDLQVLSED
jgi:cytochrome P450